MMATQKKGRFFRQLNYPNGCGLVADCLLSDRSYLGKLFKSESTIKDIVLKSANSGELALVTVLHEIKGGEAGTFLSQITISQLSFRALSPLFDINLYSLHGRMEANRIPLWALDSDRQRTMEVVSEYDSSGY